MTDDVKDLLGAWGQWARSGEERLGFKNSWDTIFAMAPEPDPSAQKRTSKKEAVFISDQNALRIDHIVSQLSRSSPISALALKARYVDCVSIEAIGKGTLAVYVYGEASEKAVGKHKVRELLAQAEGYIAGALNSGFQ